MNKFQEKYATEAEARGAAVLKHGLQHCSIILSRGEVLPRRHGQRVRSDMGTSGVFRASAGPKGARWRKARTDE